MSVLRRALRSGGAAALALTLPVCAAAPVSGAAPDAMPVIAVNVHRPLAPVSPALTGVNNNIWFDDALGLWDPETQQGDPDAVAKTARAGIGLIRYPGGTQANLFDWKRAIGPQESRGCQVDGGSGAPRDSRYGPDEHQTYVAQAGAQSSMMVAFANESPADAADWVEYLNSPVGTNPRGGTAWAEVRAANGHPAPYGVRQWEIGNEHDREAERYWMSADPAVALRQYVYGGTQRQTAQPVGTGCDHRPAASVSGGGPGQTFTVHYAPVVPGSQTVYVGGTAWQPVADLATAGPQDTVYTIAPATGTIRFGDGEHGAVPPAGAVVTADYDSGPHPGFLDFYRTMKAADPGIDVLATWAPITPGTGLGGTSFAELMRANGHGAEYDGVTIHPYTNFRRDFGDRLDSAQQGHDWHLIGEANATRLVTDLVADLRANAPPGRYVALSEFGALFFGAADTTAYPAWNTAMSHALYMASQWTRWANLGLPWTQGNTLVSEAPGGLRAVLGGAPGFVFTAEAVVREQLRPLVHGGGRVVGTQVRNNPVEQAGPTRYGSSYEKLAVTATRDGDGYLNVVVVNRDSTDPVTARLAIAGFAGRRATVTTVAGSSFTSFNSAAHPDDVRLQTQEVEVGAEHTFGAHSVTVLRISPR